jgi:hypothetical protein
MLKLIYQSLKIAHIDEHDWNFESDHFFSFSTITQNSKIVYIVLSLPEIFSISPIAMRGSETSDMHLFDLFACVCVCVCVRETFMHAWLYISAHACVLVKKYARPGVFSHFSISLLSLFLTLLIV